MKDIHELAMKRFAEDTTWMEKTGGYAKDMTLRDHFAGLAMQGLVALDVTADNDVLSQEVYKLADAMLKGRNK